MYTTPKFVKINFEEIVITAENYIWKFQKQIEKILIFSQHDFSKSDILHASLRACIVLIEVSKYV